MSLEQLGVLRDTFADVSRFRTELYACLTASGDALFELCDVLLCTDGPARTLVDRGEGKHQMVPGWPYSIVARLETGRTLWTAVLDAVRLEPGADVAAVTTVQIRAVVE